jgi:hypothetical protein
METFDASKVLNGKSLAIWVNSEKMAEVKSVKAETTVNTDKIPIAGQLGEEEIPAGTSGSGTLVTHKSANGFGAEINAALKTGKSYLFDLTSEITSEDGESERVTIENCKVTKYAPISADITKAGTEDTIEFSYNPNNVTNE